MKKSVEVSHLHFVTVRTNRNFTSEARMILFIHNELSTKKIVRSLLAQHFSVWATKQIALRIKESTAKDLSGSKCKKVIKLYFPDLYL